MPTLVVAGGTSASLGRSIVSALLSSPSKKSWDAIILSRSTKVPLWLQAIDPKGARTTVKAIDYLSVDSLTSSVQGVDTLISVVSAIDGNRAQIEKNLLHATIKAGGRRFAPTAWGFGAKSYQIGISKFINEGVWEECLAHQDKIECGRFHNGMFLNYLGHGIFSPPEKKDDETLVQEMSKDGGYATGADHAIEGLQPDGEMADKSGAFLVSIRGGIAEIPVTKNGEWPVLTTTTLRDIGRFVVASLDLPKWEKEMSMVGDSLTMGELVDLVQEITGKQLKVTKLTPEILAQQRAALQPHQFLEQVWNELKSNFCANEKGITNLDGVVNRLCPEVKPQTVREYLETHWAQFQAEQK